MSSFEEYLSSLNEHQRVVQSIAVEMLGSSYNLAKSNGFRSWLSTNSQKESEIWTQDTNKAQKENTVLKVKKGRNPRVKPIYKKLLSFLGKSFSEKIVYLERIELDVLPNSGGVYWITDEKNILFLGTTSDLKKNITLALKSIRKKTSDDILKESVNQIIFNNYKIGGPTLCVVYVETSNTKDRIRIKNTTKNEKDFTPVLE